MLLRREKVASEKATIKGEIHTLVLIASSKKSALSLPCMYGGSNKISELQPMTVLA